MLAIVIPTDIPSQSIVAEEFGEIDYCDTYCTIANNTKITVDQMLNRVFATPAWVKALLALRNCLMRPFGLKTGRETEALGREYYEPDTRALFFKVHSRNKNEIVLAEDDKHLNFRTSVLLLHDVEHVFIYITTIVRFNNFWGRLYFVPVKPFHKLIVRSMLRRSVLQTKLSDN